MSHPRNLPGPTDCSVKTDFSENHLIEEVLSLWDMADLAPRIDITYSKRLTKSLGRTRVDRRRIRLNADLASADETLLREVLCHELAHVVVHELHGAGKAPHGREWRELMQRAGQEPRVRLSLGRQGRGEPRKRRRYEHLCPVCQSMRTAARPITGWRCGQCRAAGLDGRLLVREVSA